MKNNQKHSVFFAARTLFAGLAHTSHRVRYASLLAMVALSGGLEAKAASPSSLFAVIIPGTTVDLKTKTIAGWLLFVTVIFLAIRAIMVSMSSADERSKEERDDKIKAAWIAFGSGLAIFGALVAMGLISLTDVQSAASQF